MWLLRIDPDKQRQQIKPSCLQTKEACLLLGHFCNDRASSFTLGFYWCILLFFLESHMSHFLGECKSFPPFYEWNKCGFVEKDFCVKGRKSLAEPEGLGCTFQPEPA